MRYFQPKEYQYVSQYTPAMMELDYKAGQELVKQEDAFDKDIFDAKNKYHINKGLFAKQEEVDKANQFIDNNLTSIANDVSSGKLQAREGINRINMLSNHINTNKDFRGLKKDEEAAKIAEALRVSGKLDNALNPYGESSFSLKDGKLFAQPVNASELDEKVATLYNFKQPGNILVDEKPFFDYLKPSMIEEKIKGAGFKEGKSVGGFKTWIDKNGVERTREIEKNAVIELAKDYNKANPHSLTREYFNRSMFGQPEEIVNDLYATKMGESYSGYFNEKITEDKTTHGILPQENSNSNNKEPKLTPTTSLKMPASTVEIEKQKLPLNSEGKIKLHVPSAFSNSHQELPFGNSEADKPFMKYSNQELNAIKSFIESSTKTKKDWGHFTKNNLINASTTSNVLPLASAKKLIKEINDSGYLENYNKLMETDGATILTSPTSTIMSEPLLQGLFGNKIGSSNLNVSHVLSRFGEKYPLYDKESNTEITLKDAMKDLKGTEKAYISQTSYDDVTGLLLGENYYKPIVISLNGKEYIMPNQLKADSNTLNSQEINMEQVLVEASKIHNLSNSIKKTQEDGIEVFKNSQYPGIATYNSKLIDKNGNLTPFSLKGKNYILSAQSADELAVLHNQYVYQQYLNSQKK